MSADHRRVIAVVVIWLVLVALVLWLGATQDRDIQKHPPTTQTSAWVPSDSSSISEPTAPATFPPPTFAPGAPCPLKAELAKLCTPGDL